MLTILEDARKKRDYSLEEIADQCGISIYVVRKYLQEVIPSITDRTGQGKATRYGENTRNSIRFIQMLKKQAVLSLVQITEVMKELGQDGINRVARGEEPLEISLATVGTDGKLKFPEGYKGASDGRQTILLEGNTAKTLSKADQRMPLYSLAPKEGRVPEQNDWNTYPVGDNIEVRYKGELSEDQFDELKVVSRILKSIIER